MTVTGSRGYREFRFLGRPSKQHKQLDTLGHFTFWLRPWPSLLAEPKTTLSQRWAKK